MPQEIVLNSRKTGRVNVNERRRCRCSNVAKESNHNDPRIGAERRGPDKPTADRKAGKFMACRRRESAGNEKQNSNWLASQAKTRQGIYWEQAFG